MWPDMKNIVAQQAYRPEIDGLRALAVLLVVSYHYFAVRGGFIGVDIFFVISGYLISHQIFTDLDRGRFSLLEFYAKRIRRIFPPLLLMIVATLIAGWLLLLPTDFQSLGKHAAAGVAYVSNLLLWTEAGYFDTPSGYKPFLHLWSLGIEEQFYLTWPLAMILLYRYARIKLSVLLVLTALSFVLSLIATVNNQNMAFYMPVTRFWELAAGGVLAYCALHPFTILNQGIGRRMQGWVTKYAFVIGLSVLVAVVLLVDKNSAYPGFWALMPVMGTCLILVREPQSLLKQKILTQPTLVIIGKISYGIYLWHWPLLVLMHLSDQTSGVAKIIALILSFVLAYATYVLLEIPVRSIAVTRSSAIKFILFGVFATVLVAGSGLLFASGAVHRSWDEKLIHSEYSEPASGCALDARADQNIDYAALSVCEKIKHPGRPSVFLLGDSHAFGLYQGLAPYLERQEINLIGLPAMYCTPLSLMDTRATCAHYNKWLQGEIARLRPDLVVIFAYHALWAEDEHYAEPQAYATYLWQAADHLKSLGAGQVLVIGQIPTWVNSLPHNINLNFLRKGLPVPAHTMTGVDRGSLDMDATMHASRLPGVEYLSLRESLCTSDGCLTSVGDQYPNDLLVHDYGHLTKNGARYLAEYFIGQKIMQLLK
jgi:peptidoglycan/LPS O-acetylase OafA/YrhL